jgi:hypothetical protein
MIFVPHRKHAYGLHSLLGDGFSFLYLDDVRTSQKAHVWPSTACYGDIFTSLYVMMVVPHWKHGLFFFVTLSAAGTMPEGIFSTEHSPSIRAEVKNPHTYKPIYAFMTGCLTGS